MKLQRAEHVNKHVEGLEGTSRGAYRVVGTPFLVLKDKQQGYWFVLFIFSKELRAHSAWLKRHGLNRIALRSHSFPTRARALDALQMALEEDPL